VRKSVFVSDNDRKKSCARARFYRHKEKEGITSGPCYYCGTTDTVAHHEDYDKPCDIIWLCERCHRRRHIGMGSCGVREIIHPSFMKTLDELKLYAVARQNPTLVAAINLVGSGAGAWVAQYICVPRIFASPQDVPETVHRPGAAPPP
jgi:hypothetical protein